ncbi:hypothetical protein HID58_014978 [Brassica napus]|uniref:Uncharacterized protein n=1 Tax=Brassica napus TaxID=3708 RepID=A0ABQ8DIP0_BRANA|nr:hypothetical protein HID58_014978 [Brassica napus]
MIKVESRKLTSDWSIFKGKDWLCSSITVEINLRRTSDETGRGSGGVTEHTRRRWWWRDESEEPQMLYLSDQHQWLPDQIESPLQMEPLRVAASDGTTPILLGAVQPEPVEKPVAESVPPWLNP